LYWYKTGFELQGVRSIFKNFITILKYINNNITYELEIPVQLQVKFKSVNSNKQKVNTLP